MTRDDGNMKPENIFAFTAFDPAFPGYVSANRTIGGGLELIVRSSPIDGREGPTASFILSPERAKELADAIEQTYVAPVDGEGSPKT